jgi:carbonic anhydrase/acetyltransferase-like protein (isoleucine patch superfamily)
MGAVVMDGARIESDAMLAAGSLLTPHKTVPRGELWGGRPARFMRKLTEEEIAHIMISANNYRLHAEEYRAMMQASPSLWR